MSGKDISKNKVFMSPYKADIEQRLAIGQSPRSIANWLKARGEDISYATINEYKKMYFNVDAAAGQIVKQKQEELINEDLETQNKLMETQRNMQLANIRAINHVSLLYNNLHDMTEYLAKLQSYDPVVAAHAAKGLYAEIRATIETLEKLKDKEGAGDDSSVAKLLSSMKKKKREMEENGE
jgi:UDP:flavonoid glycosyltransferase YjiC (YdhE family)